MENEKGISVKTWGEILGEWQMACSRLAVPECSLPLWEPWPGLCFLFLFSFTKARFSCPVSHLLLCFQKPHPTLLFFSQPFASHGYCCFIFSWDVGVVPQPKPAITSCQLMLDKEMLMSVGYQAGSLQLKSLKFLSSADCITGLTAWLGRYAAIVKQIRCLAPSFWSSVHRNSI